MIHCTSCGQELADNARFCSQCGTAVGGATPPAGTAKPVTAATPSGDGQPAGVGPGDPAQKIWTGWPSRKRHVPMLGLSLVLVLGAVIWYLAAAPSQIALWIPLVVMGATGLLLGLWTGSRMLSEPLTLRYWLTVDRLFIRRGVLNVTTDQMELIRVDDIRVRQNPIDLLFGIGNVEVIATSDSTDGDVTLTGVADPMRVAELIRTGMQTQRRRRGMYVANV